MSVAAVVSLLQVRELSGPNLYRPAPVVEARFRVDASEAGLDWPPRGAIAKIDAALAELGVSSSLLLHRPDAGDELPPAPRTVGERRLLSIAQALSAAAHRFAAIVGDGSEFACGRLSGDRGELLATIDASHIEIAREAFGAAARLVSAALAGAAFDRTAAFRAILLAARKTALTPGAAALAQACQRRGIPYRKLEERGAALLGHAANARRVDAPPERPPAAILRLDPAVEPLRPLAERMLDDLFPQTNGRIPIVAVTGVNGKTTTTRLVAHILAAGGQVVGMTCTEGIYVGGRRIEAGDCSGPQSARVVLSHPDVQAAALETARGGILRAGLGFDACDVAIVTNIGEGDHLGLAGIETPAQLARVKRTLVEAVAPRGAAVLNAEDELVAAMAPSCPGVVVYFARRGDHPLVIESRQRGGRVAFVRDGAIVLAEGEAEFPLLALERIPLTHRGRIGFQIENSLAATAAAWAMGKPCELIRLGLETFSAGMSDLPGRFNLLDFHGATVIVDYGHNASSLAAIVEALGQFPQSRRLAVYSAAGDRRDSDLVRQGEVLGEAFDEVVLFEDNYRRGRAPGEIIRLFRQGLAAATRTLAIEEAHSWRQAVELALSRLGAGDLLVLQADEIDDTVDWLTRRLEEDAGLREVELDRVKERTRVAVSCVGSAKLDTALGSMSDRGASIVPPCHAKAHDTATPLAPC